MKYIRTSFSFPEDIYNALMQRAQEKNHPLIKTLLELIEPALEKERKKEREKSYRALRAMRGFAHGNEGTPTDLSENVDAYVYGDKSTFSDQSKKKLK